MASGGDYLRNQRVYRDKSTSYSVAVGDTATVTAIAGRVAHAIFVQKIHVYFSTSVAQTLTFQDTASTPIIIAQTDSSPGAGAEYIIDFGPQGFKLTEGKDLQMVISGAGLVARVEIEAYLRQSSSMAWDAGSSQQ